MDITYLGHSAFKLRGKKATVVIDPFAAEKVGLKFPKTDADVVIVSHEHDDHNAIEQIGGTPFVVMGPGEYEVKGVGIIGIPSFHDSEQGSVRGKNTIYTIEVDGIHIVHLGDLGTMLTDKEIELLGSVDILMIPVGGTYTITAKQASELITEIEPAIVLPMHYGRKELDEKIYGALTPVSTFLTAMGIEEQPKIPKLSITKDKIPEHMQVIVLE